MSNRRAPQLQLVTESDGQSHRETEGTRARSKPALAVWRLQRTSTSILPAELARQLIAHYSDPGDLVLTGERGSAALIQARRLRRRALALRGKNRQVGDSGVAAKSVVALWPNERGDLVIAALNANVKHERVGDIAARLAVRLKPDAFLVLAVDDTRDRLGAIVNAFQLQGLRYWQHIIALDPSTLEEDVATGHCFGRCPSLRCHRDLLVFRRPAHEDAVANEAAAVAELAA